MAVVYLFSVDSSFADQHLRLNRENGTAPVGGTVVPVDIGALGLPSAPVKSVQRNEGGEFFGSDFLTVDEDVSLIESEIKTVLGDGKIFTRSIVDEVTGGPFYEVTAGITGPTELDLTNPYQLSHTRLRNTEFESVLEGTGQAMRIQGTQRLIVSTGLGGSLMFPTTPPADNQVMTSGVAGAMAWADPPAVGIENGVQVDRGGKLFSSDAFALSQDATAIRLTSEVPAGDSFFFEARRGADALFTLNTGTNISSLTLRSSVGGPLISLTATPTVSFLSRAGAGYLEIGAPFLVLNSNGVKTAMPTASPSVGNLLGVVSFGPTQAGSAYQLGWVQNPTSGTYAAAVSVLIGLTAASVVKAFFQRIGDIVFVAVTWTATRTAAGLKSANFDLPVPRTAGNFTAAGDVTGTLTFDSVPTTAVSQLGIEAVPGTQTIRVTGNSATAAGVLTCGMTFTYSLT